MDLLLFLPVHLAASEDNVEALCRILDEDPGLVEAGGFYTPLYYAVHQGSLAAARVLLDRGASVDKTDEQGGSYLWWACFEGRADLVSLLLSRGADASVRNKDGRTALIAATLGMWTRGSDHVAVIRLLLKDGRAAVDACDRIGCTALWYACLEERSEIARVLLVEGLADHNKTGKKGVTPLFAAEVSKNVECTRLLKWYEGELEKTFLLSRVRAMVDATETITKAPERVEAKTEAEAQRAREEAAPAYLKDRVVRGYALPVIEVGQQQRKRVAEDGDEEEEERAAVCEFVARWMAGDLFVEMMEGLRHRKWAPEGRPWW